jgi:hypothetical protein
MAPRGFMRGKRGQQEIVGFVLIVVIVVVALMVFLVISVRTGDDFENSVGVENMIDAIFAATSGCAISFEPKFDSYEDLMKSCADGERCDNLGILACESLNESLRDVMSDLVRSEASISGYQVSFFSSNGLGNEGVLEFSEGNCSGGVYGAQRTIVSGGDNLVFRISVC